MSMIKHKNGLFLYQQKSVEYMKKMQSLSYPTWETLHEDLYGFILSKYILLGDVTDVYNLTELAELSVAKTIRMPKEESRQLDGAHSCEGTTSAMNKKVLLLMALQKGLGIKFLPDTTADLTDTRQIAQEVWHLLAAGSKR